MNVAVQKSVNFRYLIYGSLLVSLLQLFFFIRGEDSFAIIHDCLDSEFTYLEALKREGLLLSAPEDSKVESIMNGLPRQYLRSPFNLTPLLYQLFSPFSAYVINKLLVHLTAFIGMFLFLSRYIKNLHVSVTFLLSVLFASIGFYHIQYGISVAGQPILLFAFLNILHGKTHWSDWIIIILFPFYSFLAVTLPFFLPVLLLVGFLNRQNAKRYLTFYLIATTLLIVGYVVAEWQLIFQTFQPGGELTHRVEFSHPENRVFTLSSLIDYLRNTHYHTGVIRTSAVWFLIGASIVFRKRLNLLSWFIIVSIIAISTLHLNYDWIKADVLKPMGLSFFNFSRFYFLLPFMWFVLLAQLLSQLRWSSPLTRVFTLAVLIVFGKDLIKNEKEWMLNSQLMLGKQISEPSYKQFYAQDLFEKLKFQIYSEHQNPRVLSLGMYPNIALFNGLFIVDGYQNNYPLKYKHRFRRIIESELSKSTELQEYFDDWGSRCYLLSAELGKKFMLGKSTSREVHNFEINEDTLQELNGTHVISAVKINTKHLRKVHLSGVFEQPDSFWKIWLYRIES